MIQLPRSASCGWNHWTPSPELNLLGAVVAQAAADADDDFLQAIGVSSTFIQHYKGGSKYLVSMPAPTLEASTIEIVPTVAIGTVIGAVVPNRLRELCRLHGLSIPALCTATGCSSATISKIMNYGYYPKRTDVRQRLGTPFGGEAAVWPQPPIKESTRESVKESVSESTSV